MNERIKPPAKVVDLTAEAKAHEPLGSRDKVLEKVDQYFKRYACRHLSESCHHANVVSYASGIDVLSMRPASCLTVCCSH